MHQRATPWNIEIAASIDRVDREMAAVGESARKARQAQFGLARVADSYRDQIDEPTRKVVADALARTPRDVIANQERDDDGAFRAEGESLDPDEFAFTRLVYASVIGQPLDEDYGIDLIDVERLRNEHWRVNNTVPQPVVDLVFAEIMAEESEPIG